MKTGIMLVPFSPEEVKKYAFEAARFGYDAVDFQGLINTDLELYSVSEREYEKTLAADREIIKEAGLFISQTHGPWRYPIMDSDPEQRAERFEKMSKAIRGTSVLGCPYVVLHPIMPYGKEDSDPEGVFEINLDFFGRLSSVAKEYGVTVCVENMPFEGQSLARPCDVARLIRGINSENVGFCLDTGHCARTKESPADAVYSYGRSFLRALHVHDNDSVKDQHNFPGKGVIDWKAFSQSLKDTGFDGVLSLETRVKPGSVPPEDYEKENRELYSVAKKIAECDF